MPHDKQKIMGLAGGLLKDSDDLSKKITKPNQKITLLGRFPPLLYSGNIISPPSGTAVAQQLKAPTASTVFVEDLSDEERRKVLKVLSASLIRPFGKAPACGQSALPSFTALIENPYGKSDLLRYLRKGRSRLYLLGW